MVHGSLDIRHKISLRHSVHLRITDVLHQGRRTPRVTNSGPSKKASCVGIQKSLYYPVDPSTSGRAYSGLNPYAGSYYLCAMTSHRCLIGKTILQSLAGAMSSSSSGATPNRDSFEDYPEIRGSACWKPAIKACCINMVGQAGGNSQNNSSKYLTIGGSKAPDAWTPNNNIVQNLNPDFNTVRLQTIMESIQWMVPLDSPLVSLAQQGVEAACNIIAAAPSAKNHRGKHSISNRSGQTSLK
jgi:hypothetical protein